MPYLDTSLLGSYYCRESLSEVVTLAITDAVEPVISPLVDLEFCSLVAMKVRVKEMSRSEGSKVLNQFQSHLDGGFYRMIEIGPVQYDIAKGWLARFDTSLRTNDALHLACAFISGHPLWTADQSLAQSAERLGVGHRLIGARIR